MVGNGQTERKTEMNDELKLLDFVAKEYFGFVNGLYSYQQDLYWRLEEKEFNIINKSRQIGISFFYAGYTTLKAMLGEKSNIVSPSERQSKRVMLYIDSWVEGFKTYFENIPEIKEHNKTTLRFDNGGETNALPNSPSSIRGSPSDRVFFDEYAHFLYGTDKQMWEALLPSISRGKKKHVCINSTPFGDSNLYSAMYSNRVDFPDFKSVFYHYSECPDINIDLIKRNMDSLSFSQEYEGLFLGDLGTYFPFDLLKSCVNQELEYLIDLVNCPYPLYAGVDIGRRRDFTSIFILADTGTKLRTVYKKVLKTPEEKRYENQFALLDTILATGKINRMYIDSTGIGNQLSETLMNKYSEAYPFTFTNENKTKMFPIFRKRLENKGIEYPEDMELINTLHLIQRTQVGNSVRYGSDKRTDEYGHADVAVSIVLANWCYEMEQGTKNARVVGKETGSNPNRGYARARKSVLRGIGHNRRR